MPHSNPGRRPIRFAVFEGEEVAILLLPDGTSVMMSSGTACEFLPLQYPLGSCRLRNNGSGSLHVSFDTWLPPDWKDAPGRAVVHQLAHLIHSHVRERSGDPLPDKGWIVKTRNGDPRDLRDANLVAIPADGRRNCWTRTAGLRRRKRLAAEGLNPQAEFARGWRERKAREKACSDPQIIQPASPPPNKHTINQPPAPHRGGEERPGGTPPVKPRGRGR